MNVNLLRFIPGAVGQVAFGKYVSPDYETAEKFIPPVGTRTGTPVVQGVNEVFFNLYLPSGPRPAGGWPVAIFGHGVGGSKQGGGRGIGGGASLALAASLAEQGIATIAINVVGHGFGPLSTLTVTPSVGAPVTFLEGGRGIDQNGDGIIANNEGISAAAPRSIIRDRDGQRQTVADLMQLVRVIEVGMDVGRRRPCGPGPLTHLLPRAIPRRDLRDRVPGRRAERSRRRAQCRGGTGRQTIACRRSSALPSARRWPRVRRRSSTARGLPASTGCPFSGNASTRTCRSATASRSSSVSRTEPSRVIQSPVINTVPGAMPIQEVIEHTEWVSQSGDPVAYAPHLRKAPLAGVPAKSVIFQFAKGDQIVPNPATTALSACG